MNNTFYAFLLTVLAGLSTMLGTIFIFIKKKDTNKIVLSSLAFAAGVMICVSITDLIPESINLLRDNINNISTIIISFLGILLGIIISMLIDYYLPDKPSISSDKKLYKVGFISMIAIILHNIPEGIATFVSSYQDTSLGITVTIAIALHNIPEGIAIAMPIYFATKSRYKAIKYAFLSGMAEPLGALIAFLCLKPFINDLILGIIFAVVCGIMLYISLAELIPSSQKYGYSKIALISTFLGFCMMPLTHIFTSI